MVWFSWFGSSSDGRRQGESGYGCVSKGGTRREVGGCQPRRNEVNSLNRFEGGKAEGIEIECGWG